MDRIRSGFFGCGTFLVVLGGVGLLSTFVDMGSSNRAVWAIFYGLADTFGSVTMFSVLTIGVGIILFLLIFLDKEIREGMAEEERKKNAQQNKSRYTR
jgi:hypothetical protein